MNRKKSLTGVKKLIEKLTWCMNPLQQGTRYSILISRSGDEEAGALVPKGHFAVVAGKVEEEKKRFVIELRYLRNPSLLKLLKEAAEEYGFHQQGALVLPCTPLELHYILQGNYSCI